MIHQQWGLPYKALQHVRVVVLVLQSGWKFNDRLKWIKEIFYTESELSHFLFCHSGFWSLIWWFAFYTDHINIQCPPSAYYDFRKADVQRRDITTTWRILFIANLDQRCRCITIFWKFIRAKTNCQTLIISYENLYFSPLCFFLFFFSRLTWDFIDDGKLSYS